MLLNAERLNEDDHPTRSLNAFREACRKDIYSHTKADSFTSTGNMTFCPHYLYKFFVFLILLLNVPSLEAQYQYGSASVIVQRISDVPGTDASLLLDLNILLSNISFPYVSPCGHW